MSDNASDAAVLLLETVGIARIFNPEYTGIPTHSLLDALMILSYLPKYHGWDCSYVLFVDISEFSLKLVDHDEFMVTIIDAPAYEMAKKICEHIIERHRKEDFYKSNGKPA